MRRSADTTSRHCGRAESPSRSPHLPHSPLPSRRGCGRTRDGRTCGSKRWPAHIFHPPPRISPVTKWRNDAIPHERRSRRAPERYAPATSSTPPARPEAPAPVQYPTCPPPGAANTPGSARPPSSTTPPPSPHRRRARDRTPRSASTSHNPRARTSSRRARGLSDVLTGYPTCSRVTRRARGLSDDLDADPASTRRPADAPRGRDGGRDRDTP